MRIGFGNDIHRLVEGRKLMLAGVHVPASFGELAHSDGDVVYHATMDAILGALALGDIGKHFPDNDPQYKDIDSSILMKKVTKLMNDNGYTINNIDVTITLEKPKIKDYILSMRENIASLLKTDIGNVSVKAGTNEGLDAIGRSEAVKAEVIVMLKEER